MSLIETLPGRRERPSWRLTVVGARDVTPRMREVSFIGEDLARFAHRPGQDLLLNLPTPDGVARRHYTIRRFDAAELRLDIQFVLHGASPATRFARNAVIGEEIVAEGPRGRTTIAGEADWRLFTGDETALPGIAAMIESLPRGERAVAIIEVAGPEEEQAIETDTAIEIRWLHRGGPPTAASPGLIDALASFALPPGHGQAYVIGETATVRAQRHDLIARGLPKDQIAAEGYWRPGRIGGHDHVFDPEMILRGRERGWRRAVQGAMRSGGTA